MEAPFTICTDSREQLAYRFDPVIDARGRRVRVPTVRRKLDAGDYSILGHEDEISIERKTLADLYGTIGRGHQRFRREHERLRKYRHACVIIEATWGEILYSPPRHSKVSPGVALTMSQKWPLVFGVEWIAADDRELAERICYTRLLAYWNLHCKDR